MKKICFITGTRADYGIMAPIMKEIARSGEAELQIVATNMHMSEAYGMTVKEIEADGFTVDFTVACLTGETTAGDTVRSMAKAEAGLADAFEQLQPDIAVILGDRYEALAAASAAVVFNIPVAHLHGGETTEGAIDDKFRHAITKLSTYHFAATPQYAEKIISMGEPPERVFHSGGPGAEIRPEDEDTEENKMKRADEFRKKTGIIYGEPFILFAMHPVTTLPDKGEEEVRATLEALEPFIEEGYSVVVTMPNSDPGSSKISTMTIDWAERKRMPHNGHPAVVTVKSLGSSLFRHAMDTASAMAGNSSAALIEAPSYRLPAVNIGIRQKGRAHGVTVIDTPAETGRIREALKAALSLEMKSVAMGLPIMALNPYYKEDSAAFIAQKLINI